jgi:hypothetical protein
LAAHAMREQGPHRCCSAGSCRQRFSRRRHENGRPQHPRGFSSGGGLCLCAGAGRPVARPASLVHASFPARYKHSHHAHTQHAAARLNSIDLCTTMTHRPTINPPHRPRGGIDRRRDRSLQLRAVSHRRSQPQCGISSRRNFKPTEQLPPPGGHLQAGTQRRPGN